MKKSIVTILLASCLMVLCFDLAACSTPATTSSATNEGADASASQDAEASDETPAAEVAADVDYSSDSLIAFHASMGEDISGFSEVSKENCGACHGEWSTMVAETEGLLQDGELSANPHQNHMFKEFECSDCHHLTEGSTLGCHSCHSWEITRDNGTWVA